MDIYELIKERVDLLAYIEEQTGQRAKHVGSGTYRIIPCPICGKSKKGFNINTREKLFNAFCCSKGGSIIDAIMLFEGLNEDEARERGKQLAGIIDEPKRYFKKEGPKVQQNQKTQVPAPKVEQEPERKIYPGISSLIEMASKEVNKTDYYQKRGLSEKTIKKHRLGYRTFKVEYEINGQKKQLREEYKFVLPVNDKLLIFRSDNPEAEVKYFNFGSTKGNFFNGRYLEQPEEAGKMIFVVEGIFDALSLEEMGRSAIALNSTSNTKSFLEAVKERREKLQDKYFIVALDQDTAGKIARQELLEGLKQLGFKAFSFNWPENYKDLNELLIKDRAFFKLLLEDLEAGGGTVYASLGNFLLEIEESRSFRPISTGFKKLDELLEGGFYPGLYVYGGLTGLGKTALIQQIADYIAGNGTGVIYFALEMSAKELIARSLVREMFLLNDKTAVLTPSLKAMLRGAVDINQLKQAIANYSLTAKNLKIVEGAFNTRVMDIRQEIENYLLLTGKKPVVVVDYLQIIRPEDDRLSDKQANDRNIVGLKLISRDYGLPVVVISSLNRASYQQTISFEAFKETGAIEFTADVIMGLEFSGIEEASDKKAFIEKAFKEEIREIRLKVLKHRQGKNGQVEFYYTPKVGYFEEREGE